MFVHPIAVKAHQDHKRRQLSAYFEKNQHTGTKTKRVSRPSLIRRPYGKTSVA